MNKNKRYIVYDRVLSGNARAAHRSDGWVFDPTYYSRRPSPAEIARKKKIKALKK